MIIINKSYTEEEIFLFFLGIISKGVKLEQIIEFFNSEDLVKVNELWNLAIAEWEDGKLAKAWARPLYDKDDEDFMWWDKY